jgi:hypothetical protein
MNRFKIGDLVWVPDRTQAYDCLEAGSRYNIDGPLYGLVLEVNEKSEPSKVRVSLGKLATPAEVWLKANQIYKEDGETYGKIC